VETFNWAGVVIALIGVISAWLANRAAKNAAKSSADASVTNERVKAETEAYKRARAMDVETIQRQDEELKELREEMKKLREDNRALHAENERLKQRVSSLEGRRRNG